MVRLTRVYFCCLLVLLPLKFGNVIPNMEQTFFPLDGWEWLLAPWPPFLFPVLAAPVLLAVGFTARCRRLTKEQWLLVAGFSGLLLAALIGLIRTTERDYAQLFVWHLLGTLGLLLGALLQNAVDPAFKSRALACVAAGAILASISGWSQAYGDVNERSAEYLRQQTSPANPELVAAMENRLKSTRVSGLFIYPNSFAAHLLLTIPLTLALFWKLGESFTPVTVSRPFLVTLAGVTTGWALFLTRSRGGVAAAAGGIVLTLLVLGIKTHLRLVKVVCLCVLMALAGVVTGWALSLIRGPVGIAVIAGPVVLALLVFGIKHPRRLVRFVAISAVVLVLATPVLFMGWVGLADFNQGRSLSSLKKRGGYLKAGVEMAVQAPLTGVGVGEYFPWYMRLKPKDLTGKGNDEVTRVPHNVATLFFSQCGIVGFLAVVFWGGCCVILPAVMIYRREKIRLLDVAVFTGIVAWLGHALLDFNFQISGTVGTFAVLTAFLFAGAPPANAGTAKSSASLGNIWRQVFISVLAVVCFAGIWRWPGEKAYQEFYQALEGGKPWETCRRLGETAREKLPWSPYPDMVMARVSINDKRLPDAVRYMRRVVERAPHRGGDWYLLAQLNAQTGDRQGAWAALAHARVWNRDLRERYP